MDTPLPLRGQFRVPGSKSITNRALICGALARGESTLRNASESDDSALMANGLNQTGVLVLRREGTLVVSGTGGILQAPKFPIPVGNAGTTLRFLITLAALARGRVVIEGSERMAERPNDDLVDALGALGVSVLHEHRTARFEIEGGTLHGGRVAVDGAKSSQFLSSLLLVAPYASQDVTVSVSGELASASYVAMTVDVMRGFGVTVETVDARTFHVCAGQRYCPVDFSVEPDASGASYGFAAAAMTGGTVAVPGIRRESLQGDVRFVDALERMGCTIVEEASGLVVHGAPGLRGIDIDMNTMPDVVPTLVAVALRASGPTRIRNVAHLRFKESDRLGCLGTELAKTGASIAVREDGFDIIPSPLHAVELDPHGDHRLAMTFALVGLLVPGITIRTPECVRKSFPGFWSEFERLRHSH